MDLILGFLFGILSVFPAYCLVVKQRDKLYQRIEKAIEITYMLLENSADNQLIAKEEEMDYFNWLDSTLEKQLQILKGEDKNDNK